MSQVSPEFLKSNFYISSLLEAITRKLDKTKQETCLGATASEPSFHVPEDGTAQNEQTCDLCFNPGVENVCQECDELLCFNCSKTHSRSKASSSHVLIQVTEAMQVKELQEEREGNESKSFGRTNSIE